MTKLKMFIFHDDKSNAVFYFGATIGEVVGNIGF